MINVTSNTARQLYQQEFERNMSALENIQIRELKPVLNRQYMRAAQSVQQGMLDIDFAVDRDGDRLRGLLARHYRRIAAVFGEKVFEAIEESKKSLAVPAEIKGPKDEFWTDLNRWMSTEAAKKIRHVQDTTKRNIARTISKGMEEGESHRTIAKRVRKTGRISTVRRAVTIARTETHTAAVRSVDAGIKSTRIEMEREWVSSKDDRTRSRIRKDRFEHYLKYPAGPDGEKVAQDGKFTKTGEALDYPGDGANGSAGNVINCRCVLLYKPVKRTERLKPYEPEPGWTPAKTVEEAEMWSKGKGLTVGYDKGSREALKKYGFTTRKMDVDTLNQINEGYFAVEQSLDPKLAAYLRKAKIRVGAVNTRTGGPPGITLPTEKEILMGIDPKRAITSFKDNFVDISKQGISRHEWGHVLEHAMPQLETQKMGLFPMKYFSSEYAKINFREKWAEFVTMITKPGFKVATLPKEAQVVAKRFLKKAKR